MRKFAWLTVVFALCAHAEVYKWVDEKGKTQYGEFPPAGAAATRMNAPPGPPDAPPTEAKAKEEQKASSKEGREDRCKFERQQDAVLGGNADVTFKNDKGEIVAMDEARRNKARELVRENVKKYCS